MKLFVLFCLLSECNLAKDSATREEDSFECASKCMNDLNNIELCRCHQNNEIGNETQFAYITIVGIQ